MFDIEENYNYILENIEGLVVIDTDERIVYITENLSIKHGYDSKSSLIGKNIKDIIPPGVNNLYRVLDTKKKQIGEVYYFKDIIIVSDGFPLFKDDEMIGAFEYDVFQNTYMLSEFMEKLSEIKDELNYYKTEYTKISSKYSIEDIIGTSDSIKKVKNKIEKVSTTNSSILIEAETGCGKELVAHSIHKLSDRQNQNFVKVNCSSIPESLFESELFGYEEGSFTGALKGGRKGKAELANGGTLFLDEIDKLPISQQPKLLRFLQEKEITRLGSNHEIPVDIRVITASNRKLEDMVRKGEFREDLFYRIGVIKVEIPPLRERKKDIKALVSYFLNVINDELERERHRVELVDQEVIDMLMKSNWPGNVRELRNVLEEAMNNCYEPILRIEHFESYIIKNLAANNIQEEKTINLDKIKDQAEKAYILKVMDFCKGNKAKAAEMMDISRQTLYNKLEKMNVGLGDENV